MSVESEQDVVELQVTVDDSVLVEVLQRKTDLCSVEPDSWLVCACIKPSNNLLSTLGAKLASLDVQHQITSANVLHDKVDSRLSLD